MDKMQTQASFIWQNSVVAKGFSAQLQGDFKKKKMHLKLYLECKKIDPNYTTVNSLEWLIKHDVEANKTGV